MLYYLKLQKQVIFTKWLIYANKNSQIQPFTILELRIWLNLQFKCNIPKPQSFMNTAIFFGIILYFKSVDFFFSMLYTNYTSCKEELWKR